MFVKLRNLSNRAALTVNEALRNESAKKMLKVTKMLAMTCVLVLSIGSIAQAAISTDFFEKLVKLIEAIFAIVGILMAVMAIPKLVTSIRDDDAREQQKAITQLVVGGVLACITVFAEILDVDGMIKNAVQDLTNATSTTGTTSTAK